MAVHDECYTVYWILNHFGSRDRSDGSLFVDRVQFQSTADLILEAEMIIHEIYAYNIAFRSGP